MSVYNSEQYLSEAIESILNQSFKDFELIIIDDHSTDSSYKIIKAYSEEDQRIKLLKNRENIGLTKSLNKCLKSAKGKYIARMDADDISLPERFRIQYNYLESNKDVFLVGGGCIRIDNTGKQRGISNQITNERRLLRTIKKRNRIIHPTIMFRNDKVTYYREKFVYSQDHDLYLCLISNGRIIKNIPDILIKYRISREAISSINNTKQKLFSLKAIEFYHQRIQMNIDEYLTFDPRSILELDIETYENKFFLELEIKTAFKTNNFLRVRELSKRYFEKYSFYNKYLAYYLLSFCGEKTITNLRKLLS